MATPQPISAYNNNDSGFQNNGFYRNDSLIKKILELESQLTHLGNEASNEVKKHGGPSCRRHTFNVNFQ